MFAFNAAFTSDETGLASAASLVIAAMAGILSFVYYRAAQHQRRADVR